MVAEVESSRSSGSIPGTRIRSPNPFHTLDGTVVEPTISLALTCSSYMLREHKVLKELKEGKH
jgi:hypothetical protein